MKTSWTLIYLGSNRGRKHETDLIVCKCSRRLAEKSRNTGKLKNKQTNIKHLDSHSVHPNMSTVGMVSPGATGMKGTRHGSLTSGSLEEQAPYRKSSEKWWHEQLTWGSQGVSNRRWPLTQVFKNDGAEYKWAQQNKEGWAFRTKEPAWTKTQGRSVVGEERKSRKGNTPEKNTERGFSRGGLTQKEWRQRARITGNPQVQVNSYSVHVRTLYWNCGAKE